MSIKAILVILVMHLATPAAAQLVGDQLPAGRVTPEAEAVKKDLENSRYRFGALRVQPVFTLRDLGYQGNVYATSGGEVGDWSSTVAAGARTILPVGRKVFLRADAIPEYTWYRRVADHRRFGGEYSATALALFNRMSGEASIRPRRTVARVSSENERALPTTTVYAFARAEVEPLRRLILFVSDESLRTRYQFAQTEPEVGRAVEQLERNERATRGGVRYKFKPYFSVAAGLETTKSTFLNSGDRSNTSKAVLADVRYGRPRTLLNVSIASRRGQSDASGSPASFRSYSETTGSYSLIHQLGAPVTLGLVGRRALTYSTDAFNAYFIETRNSASATFPFSRVAMVRLSAEAGSNQYPVKVKVGDQTLARSEDVLAFSGGLALKLFRNIALSMVASNTKYDSTVAGYDRTLFSLTTTLVFAVSGDFFDERR